MLEVHTIKLKISLIKLNLDFLVIILPSKTQIMFRIVFPRSKTIANPFEDFLTFEKFIVKILGEKQFSFARWLLQNSV